MLHLCHLRCQIVGMNHVHHLDAGTLCPRGAFFVNGKGGLFARARMVCHVLLVETARGLVLVDGGLGLGDVERPERLGKSWVRRVHPRLVRERTAAAQVEALGYARDDVRHVVLTHLDLDHAGAVPDFPRAEVHVHARELARATARETPSEKRRYVVEHLPEPARVRPFDDGGETWRGFGGVRELLPGLPDLLLVPLPGHTEGHTAIAVHDGTRWLFHAGDAYFFHGQMEERPRVPLALRFFQRRADTDRALREANQERVRELALASRGEVEVFSAHDPVEYDRLAAFAR